MDRIKTTIEKEEEIVKQENEVANQEKKEQTAKKVVLKKESLQTFSVSITQSEPKKVEEVVEEVPQTNAYVSNFENLTISDVKKELEEQEKERLVKEREKIVQKFVEEKAETVEEPEVAFKDETIEVQGKKPVRKLVIEKPNYDFIPESKKTTKSKKKSKWKTVAVACALAIATIGCVAGTVMIDNLQSAYIELQDEYSLNLITYLRNINNLNATNKSLDFLETYPEDLNPPSSVGETTNWFDNLANFIAGIFGG